MSRWQDRPIQDHEHAFLRALGEAVLRMQRQSGLRATELASGATVSTSTFWRITAGQRRTKRSTLGRLVAVAVEANPRLGPAEETLERLCDLAGPALVVDRSGALEPLPPATEEEVRRRFAAWQRYDRAATRARRRFEAVDERYRRLHGDYARVD